MDTKVTIIGAGVVGLAIAARLSEETEGIFVVEKNDRFGQETSSRNSEVIHSGIYYPTGSLKAILCVKGNRMLYEYCEKKSIPFRRCGKIMVANTDEEITELDRVLKQSMINGVNDGVKLTPREINALEPNIRAASALFFPSTGIIDSHSLMVRLLSDATINGAELVFKSKVTAIQKIKGGYEIGIDDPSGRFTFTSEAIINSAGLHADEISGLALIEDPLYKIHFWKGEYFSVGNGKNRLVKRLVYPVPLKNTTGLGIHATIDLNNRLKLGPNAIYMEGREPEYTVDKKHRNSFYKSALTYLPFLEETDLEPDQAGIRPKLQKPGDPVRDFIIKNEKERGFDNFINLIGIESPGLTSCLSIADYVRELIEIK